MQSLEFFAGSGLVSSILREKGFKTLTVDYNPKCKPDLIADISLLDFSTLPRLVQFLWASPDCRRLSRAAAQRHWKKETISHRNYKYTATTPEAVLSELLVARTVEYIVNYQPDVWFIENPVGRIPHLRSMRSLGHYRYAVNYADWGFGYSKETYIFSNVLLPLPVTVQKRRCPGFRSLKNKSVRSHIPAGLLYFLINYSIPYIQQHG
jgi:hypothetical protein